MINLAGVIVGIIVGVILVVKKLNPVFALFFGVIVGALVGGAMSPDAYGIVARFEGTFDIILSGTEGIMGIVTRIIAGAVLAGVLIESGAGESIAKTVVEKMGPKFVLLGVTLASVIITGIGVFMSAGVVMLAPIALAVGKRTNISKGALILALSGGAKVGNMIGPNPNTIASAEAFGLSVSDVMINGAVPALFGIITTVLLATLIKNRGAKVKDEDMTDNETDKKLPSFAKAMVGPIFAIVFLIISPIGEMLGIDFLSNNFRIDAFFVLPLAAIVGALAMGRGKLLVSDANSGIKRMSPIVLMLLGAGAIAGLVRGSYLPQMMTDLIETLGISTIFLGPASSAIMAAITGSTAAGAVLAANSFAEQIMYYGITAISGAVMINAGSTFLDIVPHGNYFLASKEGLRVGMKERIKVMPYEAIIGAVQTVAAIIMFGFIIG